MRYSYDLFCQRKGFTLQSYFTIHPQGTYDDFILFLTQRNVEHISKERFEAAKNKFFTPVKEDPVIEVTLQENLVEEKPKRTRRRRNAKKNTSNISKSES